MVVARARPRWGAKVKHERARVRAVHTSVAADPNGRAGREGC